VEEPEVLETVDTVIVVLGNAVFVAVVVAGFNVAANKYNCLSQNDKND